MNPLRLSPHKLEKTFEFFDLLGFREETSLVGEMLNVFPFTYAGPYPEKILYYPLEVLLIKDQDGLSYFSDRTKRSTIKVWSERPFELAVKLRTLVEKCSRGVSSGKLVLGTIEKNSCLSISLGSFLPFRVEIRSM